MTEHRRSAVETPRRGWVHVWVVIAVTVAAVYLVGLAGKMLANHRALQDAAAIATQVGDLETEVPALYVAAATATTDEAVGDWARGAQHLAQPGDVVVVPVPAVTPGVTPAPDPARHDSALERLRRWFTGEP